MLNIKFIILFISINIFNISVLFSNETHEKRAIDTIQKAILQLPQVKTFKNQLETYIKSTISLKKEHYNRIITTIMVFNSLINSEISTKHFKNLSINTGRFNIQPNMLYNYKVNNLNAKLMIHTSF